MTKDKLKPCPFCGGSAKIEYDRETMGMGECPEVAFVICENCGCKTKNYYIGGYYGSKDNEKNAVKMWNRRTNNE